MHWPWLLHDAKCIEIWKAGGWINEIQHTDVHKLYVSLYYIYIYPYTHPRCISTTGSSYSYRRNWIWSSNFPFLRWRSAFAETDEFRFRLLPFVWVILPMISGPIFFFFHFRTPSIRRNLVGEFHGWFQLWFQDFRCPKHDADCIINLLKARISHSGDPGLVHPMGFDTIFWDLKFGHTKEVAAKTLTVLFLVVFGWKTKVLLMIFTDFYHEIGGISKNCQKNCNAKGEFCQPGHANLAKHVFVPILQVSAFCFRDSPFQKDLMDVRSWFTWNDTLDLPPPGH